MNRQHGFLLMEVLVSLMLMCTLSLLLLKQQAATSQLFHDVYNHSLTVLEQDNAKERAFADA